MVLMRGLWTGLLFVCFMGASRAEPCEQPCGVEPGVLLDEAQPATGDLFGFPVAEFYPVGFSRAGAFAFLVSAQRCLVVDGEEICERGWSLEVMDLKTDTVIEQLWVPKLETMKTPGQRSRATALLQKHSIDGAPRAALEPRSELVINSPFTSSVSGIDVHVAKGGRSLRPFPLYRPGTRTYFNAVLSNPSPDGQDRTISLMQTGPEYKAIGRTHDFMETEVVLGSILSPWEPRIVVVVLALSNAFECGGLYGGLILAGAHLEKGTWSTTPTTFTPSQGQDPVWIFPFGCP